MAFNEATGQTILFGGTNHSQLFGDTWLWDGNEWIAYEDDYQNEYGTAFNGQTPSSRQAAFMVYDKHRQTIVMFGGRTAQAGSR